MPTLRSAPTVPESCYGPRTSCESATTTPPGRSGLHREPSRQALAADGCQSATFVYAANGMPPSGRGSAAVLAHRIVGEPAGLGAPAGDLRALVAERLGKDPARPRSWCDGQ